MEQPSLRSCAFIYAPKGTPRDSLLLEFLTSSNAVLSFFIVFVALDEVIVVVVVKKRPRSRVKGINIWLCVPAVPRWPLHGAADGCWLWGGCEAEVPDGDPHGPLSIGVTGHRAPSGCVGCSARNEWVVQQHLNGVGVIDADSIWPALSLSKENGGRVASPKPKKPTGMTASLIGTLKFYCLI